jgi:YD repeat-containing protein
VGYYTYNEANALTQEHLLPADERSYWRYDERGNCVEVESPLGTTYYTYNSRDLVTSIRWRTGVRNYFHYDANGRRYAITESTGTTYLTYDQDGLFTPSCPKTRCAVQRRESSVGSKPTRRLSLQPVATGAAEEVTNRPKPLV